MTEQQANRIIELLESIDIRLAQMEQRNIVRENWPRSVKLSADDLHALRRR